MDSEEKIFPVLIQNHHFCTKFQGWIALKKYGFLHQVAAAMPKYCSIIFHIMLP